LRQTFSETAHPRRTNRGVVDPAPENVMKTQRLLIALTVVNMALLTYSLAQPGVAGTADVAPVLRGRALEIVDERGRVRASITVMPADPSVRMPDGTTGYPETVLLRLINSSGRPNVKVQATELGGAAGFGGEDDPTYAVLSASGPNVSLKLTDKNGREQLIKP
jgi:hypothetical protein